MQSDQAFSILIIGVGIIMVPPLIPLFVVYLLFKAGHSDYQTQRRPSVYTERELHTASTRVTERLIQHRPPPNTDAAHAFHLHTASTKAQERSSTRHRSLLNSSLNYDAAYPVAFPTASMSPKPAAVPAVTTGALDDGFATNDFQLAVELSKLLEVQLERKMGAQGKGLHEKTSSVETKLSSSTVHALRYVASVRNKLIHDESLHALPDRSRFIKSFQAAQCGFQTPSAF